MKTGGENRASQSRKRTVGEAVAGELHVAEGAGGPAAARDVRGARAEAADGHTALPS